MPDALEAVAAGADDQRGFLSADSTVTQGGQVVAEDLQAIKQVIEILDLGNGPEAAHGHAQSLPDDGGLADARIGNAQLAIFLLQAFQGLVHASDIAHVLAKDQRFRIFVENVIEVIYQDLAAIDHRSVIGIFRGHLFHLHGRKGCLAVQVRAVALGIVGNGLLQPVHHLHLHRFLACAVVAYQPQDLFGGRDDVPANGLADAAQILDQGVDLFRFPAVAVLDVHKLDEILAHLQDGLLEVIPGIFPGFLHPGHCILFNLVELFFSSHSFFKDPMPHLQNTVIFLFPFQSFLAFIALVRA